MTNSSQRPDWVPPEAGAEFTTRVVAGSPARSVSGARAKRRAVDDVPTLAAAIRAGDRGALARGITLIESSAAAHRAAADELLRLLTPHSGGAVRVGITGPPGAGKSTMIDTLGTQLCRAGKRVAVLSVDPSSPVTHGSILGDKTRMEALAREPHAFIRPSPSGGELGGVARRTREAIALCEAAGFDVVLVETVGVGQSEVVVRGMVDCFLVLLLAGAGDEMQGIKKGVIELADILAVNKADGDNRARAELAREQLRRAVHWFSSAEPTGAVPVLTCSALRPESVSELWTAVSAFLERARESGALAARRQEQTLAWLDALLFDGVRAALAGDVTVARLRRRLEVDVLAGQLPVPHAARQLLDAFLRAEQSP